MLVISNRPHASLSSDFQNYSRDCSLAHGWWILFGKSSGLADFENTVDRGSAEIFDADFGLCLAYVRILGPKQNLHHGSLFSLGRNVNEFIQIISFFERNSCKLKCDTVFGIVLCYSHQACCLLYIWAKLTVAFTNLPFTLTSIFGCGCGFGFKQKFWQIDSFGEK